LTNASKDSTHLSSGQRPHRPGTALGRHNWGLAYVLDDSLVRERFTRFRVSGNSTTHSASLRVQLQLSAFAPQPQDTV